MYLNFKFPGFDECHLQAARDEVAVGAGHAEDLPPADGGGHPRPAPHRQDVRRGLPLLTHPRTRDNLIDPTEPPPVVVTVLLPRIPKKWQRP